MSKATRAGELLQHLCRLAGQQHDAYGMILTDTEGQDLVIKFSYVDQQGRGAAGYTLSDLNIVKGTTYSVILQNGGAGCLV